MPNGLTFDEKGFGYVADSGVGRGLTRIRPDGSIDRAWTAQAPATLRRVDLVNGIGINGAAVSRPLRLYDPHRKPERTSHPRADRQPGCGLGRRRPHRPCPALSTTSPCSTAEAPGRHVHHRAGVTSSRRLPARVADQRRVPVTAVAVDPAHPRRLVVTSEVGGVLEITLN